MKSSQRVLVVDDEPSIVTFMRMGLVHEGFEVAEAFDGQQALQKFLEFAPHVVILDRMLPDIAGDEVCGRIRGVSRVPILMLTARNEVDDRVSGLEAGADDYVGKPIRLHELVARVRALLRRSSSDRVCVGPLELDTLTRTVRMNGVEASLTPRECDVLRLLMKSPGQVVRREQLMQRLWGFDFDGETNVLEVHVRALRTKLGDHSRKLIRSVRGVGYALRVEDGDA